MTPDGLPISKPLAAFAVALLAYVVSVEFKDPAAWPDDLRMIDGKRRTWHFFLMDSLSKALRGLMPVTA